MLLVCLAVGVVEARGEAVIYLVNGDRMTGRIVAETPTGISLQTAWSGTVQIPRSQVVRTERRMSGVGAPPANRASVPLLRPAAAKPAIVFPPPTGATQKTLPVITAPPVRIRPLLKQTQSSTRKPIVFPPPSTPGPVAGSTAKPVQASARRGTNPNRTRVTPLQPLPTARSTEKSPTVITPPPYPMVSEEVKVVEKPRAQVPEKIPMMKLITPAPALPAKKNQSVAVAPVKSAPVTKPVMSATPKPVATQPNKELAVAPPPKAAVPVVPKVVTPASEKKPVAAAPAKTKPAVKVAAKSPAKPTAKKSAPAKAPAKPKLKGKWTHDIRLGLDLRYNSVDAQTFHTRVRSSYTRGKLRNLKDISFAYGESGDVISANKLNGSMKTDVTFDPGWYLYHVGSAGYDEVRRISLQYAIGPGVGYHLLKGKKFLFKNSKLSIDL